MNTLASLSGTPARLEGRGGRDFGKGTNKIAWGHTPPSHKKVRNFKLL
jgi:hypothetical protein